MSNEYSLKDLLPFLELDEYISFDLETTGLNPEKDKITEIAASRFVNGEFTEEFTTLINPGIPIPKNISALTGIGLAQGLSWAVMKYMIKSDWHLQPLTIAGGFLFAVLITVATGILSSLDVILDKPLKTIRDSES